MAALEADLEALCKSREEDGKQSVEVRQELTETSTKLKGTTRALNSDLTVECNQLKEAAVEQREVERSLQERTVELQTNLDAVRMDVKTAR